MKYFAIILIFLGLIIVFSSIFFSAQIFVFQKEPPQLFEKVEIYLPMEGGEFPLGDVLPLSDLFNLFAWSFFAGLLIFAGSKISMIGVGLTKKQ